MFSRINYWLYSSIFGYFIINLFLKNVTQVCARKEIDPSIKYQQALRDYSIFQSIKCNGKFDYRVFERIDRICYDCFNLFQEPRLYSQCRKDCFKNEFFDGCLEMILLNDTEDIKNMKKDRLKLSVDLPFIQRSIILPDKPQDLEAPEAPFKSIWRQIYEAPWLP